MLNIFVVLSPMNQAIINFLKWGGMSQFGMVYYTDICILLLMHLFVTSIHDVRCVHYF